MEAYACRDFEVKGKSASTVFNKRRIAQMSLHLAWLAAACQAQSRAAAAGTLQEGLRTLTNDNNPTQPKP